MGKGVARMDPAHVTPKVKLCMHTSLSLCSMSFLSLRSMDLSVRFWPLVDLGLTSERGQPLYKGEISEFQHVHYSEVPLYIQTCKGMSSIIARLKSTLIRQ